LKSNFRLSAQSDCFTVIRASFSRTNVFFEDQPGFVAFYNQFSRHLSVLEKWTNLVRRFLRHENSLLTARLNPRNLSVWATKLSAFRPISNRGAVPKGVISRTLGRCKRLNWSSVVGIYLVGNGLVSVNSRHLGDLVSKVYISAVVV